VQTNDALVRYLQANRGDSEYLVATQSSMTATPIIISTGDPVMAIGGFSGNDPAVTAADIANMVEDESVRFFLLGGGGPGGSGGVTSAITQACTAVDASAYGGTSAAGTANAQSDATNAPDGATNRDDGGMGGGASQLYDCQGAASAIRSAGGA